MLEIKTGESLGFSETGFLQQFFYYVGKFIAETRFLFLYVNQTHRFFPFGGTHL